MNEPQGPDYQYTTKLFYMVHIRPKGPVPVLALEWQISNEVPNNLAALKKAAENVTPEYMEVSSARSERSVKQQTNKQDGTLEAGNSASGGSLVWWPRRGWGLRAGLERCGVPP